MESHLTSGLWYADTPGKWGSPPNIKRTDVNANIGQCNRQYFTQNGKTVDLLGHLHCDVFNQNKFLLNGVELRLRLVKSKDAFCLMDFTDDDKFTIRIKEASLIVRRVKISPGVILAHANALTKATAKYPINRVEVKAFTMHRVILGDTLDNVILGQIPKRIIIGFVDNKAFNGNRKFNPFNFQHFNINYISLYVDGVQIPSKPLQPRFSGESQLFIDSFHTPPNIKRTDVNANIGQCNRQYFTQNGKTVDLLGHLHCDVFNQNKFLLNGVELRLRLVRSKDAFCLMDFTDDDKFTIRIKEASLIVRRVKISPGVILAHANALTKATAKYPINRVEVKAFTMHRGILGDTLDNVILGQIPKRIIIGFLDNKAFNGNRKFNPFNFQHFNINYISLYVDGVQIPSKPLQPRFSGESQLFIDSFHTLYSGTGIHFLNEALI
ncbi:hypothetical protein TSAR_016801 [Trichomalopsis sarcophagae]|uniref:Uncharacterized protein n=1 Tax=Trichomalopsis sarcophagae TaxID=543379 RepID=A0A232EDN2_9HYME|nr:hypothetical protein TSAR_016801 [Trichomalopsis sarcophagae]